MIYAWPVMYPSLHLESDCHHVTDVMLLHFLHSIYPLLQYQVESYKLLLISDILCPCEFSVGPLTYFVLSLFQFVITALDIIVFNVFGFMIFRFHTLESAQTSHTYPTAYFCSQYGVTI